MSYFTTTKPYIEVIPREKHIISHKNISKNALNVLYHLDRAGYEAYLVGGSVRDLLLGKKPKDFDVATSATPKQICKLFHNCRLVGRRFRLVHVVFSSEIIEVATFRGKHKNSFVNINISHNDQNGILLRDNVFGSMEEDAQRRDFTINSLYYSINDFTIRDYVGGMQDLKNGLIRFIGNPEIRYREDPVRMLRAVRFATKLNMHISPETAEPIERLVMLINCISPTRLFEEMQKLFQTGFSYKAYKLLRTYNLLQPILPNITRNFTENENSKMELMIIYVLKNIDNSLNNNLNTNLALLFAAMFWYTLLDTIKYFIENNILSYYDAFTTAVKNILDETCHSLAIPKHITILISDIWKLQFCMSYRYSKYVKQLANKNSIKFYTAYNLLTLRAKVEQNKKLQFLVKWWKRF